MLYRNCDADFPEWAGRELAATGLQAQILAQDGATAADVLRQQLPLIEQPPAVVTLTMGGNDLLAIYGNGAAAETVIGEVIAAGEEILSRLNAASGGARTVVTTVYDPSDGTGDADATGLWPWPAGPAVLRALNAALTGLARRHAHSWPMSTAGSWVMAPPPEPRPRCCPGPPAATCGTATSSSPTSWGAHEIRRTWWQALHPGR